MGYKRISFLALLFFASSINLPVTGTQIDDNLIGGTVVLLNQRLSQNTQEISFRPPSCRTFSFHNASELSNPILNKDLDVVDARRFKMEPTKKHDGLEKLAPLPKTESILGDRVKSQAIGFAERFLDFSNRSYFCFPQQPTTIQVELAVDNRLTGKTGQPGKVHRKEPARPSTERILYFPDRKNGLLWRRTRPHDRSENTSQLPAGRRPLLAILRRLRSMEHCFC